MRILAFPLVALVSITPLLAMATYNINNPHVLSNQAMSFAVPM